MLLNEELQTNYTISETYGNKIALILVAKANTEKNIYTYGLWQYLLHDAANPIKINLEVTVNIQAISEHILPLGREVWILHIF